MTSGSADDGNGEWLRRYRIPDPLLARHRLTQFSKLDVHWLEGDSVGTVFPMPTKRDLDDFYCNVYRTAMAKSQVEWLEPSLMKGARVLDVGAGYGLFLWTLRQCVSSAELYAVEPDEDASSSVAANATVYSDLAGFWEGRYVNEAKFDAINLSHVLEHLVDPVESLRRLSMYLAPGGALLVETPNDRREELMSSSRTNDLPHLWFFGIEGLIKCVERAGFEVVRASCVGIRRRGVPKGSFFHRVRRAARIRVSGQLSLLGDADWYAEGGDRSDVRVLARLRTGAE